MLILDPQGVPPLRRRRDRQDLLQEPEARRQGALSLSLYTYMYIYIYIYIYIYTQSAHWPMVGVGCGWVWVLEGVGECVWVGGLLQEPEARRQG